MMIVKRVDEINDMVITVDPYGRENYYNLDKFDYMPKEGDEVVELKGPHGRYFVPASELETPALPRKGVNKWLYAFLAFFLGIFGCHEFYAGRNRKGFLYLAFCWTGIPVLLSFGDMFIALFKRSDADGNIYF